MPLPPSAKTADWSSEDAQNLRGFLESVSGQRFLIHLAESCPELLGGGEINSILIRSGEVKGHSAVVNLVVSLTVEVPDTLPERKSERYPDIDDESKWPDENLTK